jgi:hypothetical protein
MNRVLSDRWTAFSLVSMLVASLALNGCDYLFDSCYHGDVALVGRPPVTVAVSDSATGRPAARGATVTIAYEATTDTHVFPDSGSDSVQYSTKFVLPGTYDVRVTKPGYKDWEQIVDGQAGSCNVSDGVLVVAKLQPIG